MVCAQHVLATIFPDFYSIRPRFSFLCIANLHSIAYGSALGWTSSAFLVLEDEEATPMMAGPLTQMHFSWVGSCLGIGGVIGTLAVGWLCEKFGRKPVHLYTGLLSMASWILVILADNVWWICLARILVGFSGAGCYIILPLLVAEISEDRIRGALGAILTLSSNLGILLGFVAGNFFDYYMMPKVMLSIPALFFACFMFFPESPYFLVKQNRMEVSCPLTMIIDLVN